MENNNIPHIPKPPVRYGVIGLGRMGTLHLENLLKIGPKIQVTAVSDVDAKRLKYAKKRNPTAIATSDYKSLLGSVDAVSICTPTETHCEIAEFFLENKVATLVEKPIAVNLTEAQKILWASQATKTPLHIGHIERFNPTIIKAKELINRPIFIETVRFGPYEPRVHGIGVILDLMIHDLDLILWLLSDLDVTLEEFQAQGISIISPHEDMVKVRLRFREKNVSHPILVDLTASRLSMDRMRKMRIYQEDSSLNLDLLNHKLHYHRPRTFPLTDVKDIRTIKPKLPKTNPLLQELEYFTRSVLSKNSRDVHPREAWDALELALQLINTLERKNLHQPSAPQTVLAGS
ncbi:MAG: Gfo/Idh/MocA family oxidoreductase [Elusimicrobiota bacterium]